jgi:hypothetical protein
MTQEEKEKYLLAYKNSHKSKVKEKSMKITVKKQPSRETKPEE